MSGVRNLRAMFEQKGDSNLPGDDRGRSPGPSGFASPSPSASPRPLSKVRTAFVFVEKDGRRGLQRTPSIDSASASSRRLSDETDTTTPQPLPERTDVFADGMAQNTMAFKMNLVNDPIPESPNRDTPVRLSPKKELNTTPLLPNANPDKTTDEEDPRAHMISGDPTKSSSARVGGTVLNNGIADSLNATPTKIKASKPADLPKPAPAPKAAVKTVAAAPKSPKAAKAPNAKEPVKASGPTTSSANPKKPSTINRTLASKPSAIDLAKTNTGFVKPKPKSPTRPVKLPSSLLAPTASSAQKLGNGTAAPSTRQSLSRASGSTLNLPASSAAQRAPSRNSVTATGTSSGAKSLRHKPSTVGRQRPSLGPPPKPAAKEQPASKKESQVDESFLARMMRPTASSSSKTSEKAPVTPPRKLSVPTKKTEVKDVERNAKKVAAKIQASSTKAKTAKDSVKPVADEQPTAKEIAPTVAQAETAEAAIEGAKLSTDTAEAPMVEEATLKSEPTAEDVAPVVAQEETAEDIVETAKVSPETAVEQSESETELQALERAATGSDQVEDVQEEEIIEAATSPTLVSEEPSKIEDIEDVVGPTEVHIEAVPAQETSSTTEPVTDLVEEATSEEAEIESFPPAESIVHPATVLMMHATGPDGATETP
ncbi:hypothetical protein F5Y16DRAFT_388565 [Xylariaceae sp. FL0255]|nr:hypothetical protein F5Y16DRAFT_388565 [Xylariaceae sp. FL0255]